MNPTAMLRATLHADPFQPFDVVLTNGKLTTIHAFICTEPDGTEGIPAFVAPDGLAYPLVCADAESSARIRLSF